MAIWISRTTSRAQPKLFEQLNKKRASLQSIHSSDSGAAGGGRRGIAGAVDTSYGNIELFPTPETNWLLGNSSPATHNNVQSFNPYASDANSGYFGNFGGPNAGNYGPAILNSGDSRHQRNVFNAAASIPKTKVVDSDETLV